MGTVTRFLTAVWVTDTATGDTGTAMILNTGTDMDMIMDTGIHMKILTATVRSGAVFVYLWIVDFNYFISKAFKNMHFQ